jgi:hypothetical protein
MLGGCRNLMADIAPEQEWPQLSNVLDRRAVVTVARQMMRG